ncbi:methionine sulfoxide reductase [candidate division KSB1 bacterium 4572_119]|nr:MAG: methionine sulfoxide reductase [candidate division KSB1 bacterium 4572_119]
MKNIRLVRVLLNAIILGLMLQNNVFSQSLAGEKSMKYNKLSEEEKRIILNKGTERPFTGKYYKNDKKGNYLCKRCNAPLYSSADKFDSYCGWPSFDDEIPGAIKRQLDADGIRTEILCANCNGHLGHIFFNEGFTNKNVRHCVNSISLNFIAEDEKQHQLQEAYFAGGCFWGVEYFFQQTEGVISTRVGYMGGSKANPTYEEVCYGATGHVETIKVIFDAKQTSFEKLGRLFFEIHDPTQVNRQGPDIGEQYRSVIFYQNEKQKKTADSLIKLLKKKDFKVATQLEKADTFWEAEEYHQDYYLKTGKLPYCHFRKKRF